MPLTDTLSHEAGLLKDTVAMSTPVTAVANFASEQIATQKEKLAAAGLVKFLANKFVFWGSVLLIGGFVLGVVAYEVKSIGSKAMLDGLKKAMSVEEAFFAGIKNPLTGNAWGGWNIVKDVQDIGSAAATTFQDVGQFASNFGTGFILSFTRGLPAAGEMLGGGIAYSFGWASEQIFPWMMLIGIVLLAAGAILLVLNWYAKNWYEYILPRAVIRNKAKKRRWLQKPLDPIIVPQRIQQEAADWNVTEAVINGLAFNGAADTYQDALMQREAGRSLARKRIGMADKVIESKAEKAIEEETGKTAEQIDDLTSKFLQAGLEIPKEEWINLIEAKKVAVVAVSPTGELSEMTAQNGMLRRMAASRGIAAIARTVDSSGKVGAASVGLFASQIGNIAAKSGQRHALFGNEILIGQVANDQERRGETSHTYHKLAVGDGAPPPMEPWTFLPDIGLYFAWYDEEKEPEALPPKKEDRDVIPKEELPKGEPKELPEKKEKPGRPPLPTITLPIQPPEPPAEPESAPAVAVEPVPEPPITMEELNAMTPEERTEFVRYYPNRIPDAYWEEVGKEERI